MSEQQVAAVAEAMALQPWLAAAPMSLVLQYVALLKQRGVLRAISVILAVVTGVVCTLAVAALVLDPGNLWQLVLGMASPPIFVFTVGTLLMGLIVAKRPRTGASREAW